MNGVWVGWAQEKINGVNSPQFEGDREDMFGRFVETVDP